MRPPKSGFPPFFGDVQTGPAKQNYCALRYPAVGDSGYQVVFTAIPFESVPTAEDRSLLMARILDWLQGDDDGPVVTVLAPNGGESWPADSTRYIDWVATDASNIDSVTILLSVDGGNTFPHDVIRAKENMAPYPWQVPPYYSNSAVIKVLAYDEHYNVGEDVSDSLFAIADIIPPAAVDDLTAHLSPAGKSSSGDIRLMWSPVQDNNGVAYYVVYRGFAPEQVTDSIAAPADTEYVDAGAVGDTLANYIYLVRAVDMVGNKSSDSNCVGEFDRRMLNLNPWDSSKDRE
jgi:hypothetical protein